MTGNTSHGRVVPLISYDVQTRWGRVFLKKQMYLRQQDSAKGGGVKVADVVDGGSPMMRAERGRGPICKHG